MTSDRDYLNDLTDQELKDAADAFGTKKGLRAVVIKDLRENGVTEDQYRNLFPLPEPEGVITSGDVAPPRLDEPVEEEVVVIEEPAEPVVVTAQRKVLPQADYLIRMERENLHFEFGKYVFTSENPYQIMPAPDAQAILTKETGFRQAFPEELQEFYS